MVIQKLFGKKPGRSSDDRDELPSILFDDEGVERSIFTLPPTDSPHLDSVLVFAMPKSGSVLLDRIMRDLAPHVGLTYVSIMEEFFKLGLPDNKFPPATEAIFLDRGYCYGGFRYFPRKFEIPIVSKVRKVLLMRDPRDMLVSHYFSMLKSHPGRGAALASSSNRMYARDLAEGLEINAYVLKMWKRFDIFLNNYRILCDQEDVKIYRYEDVIYKKEQWVGDLCAYFGWDVPDKLKAKIAKKHDVIPGKERDDQHIRQVHPGNYRRKLAADTIDKLNGHLSENMAYFGYTSD